MKICLRIAPEANFLISVFKHQIVHADGVSVPDAHLLHALEYTRLAQDAVKVHAAFIVGEVDGCDKALEPRAFNDARLSEGQVR